MGRVNGLSEYPAFLYTETYRKSWPKSDHDQVPPSPGPMIGSVAPGPARCNIIGLITDLACTTPGITFDSGGFIHLSEGGKRTIPTVSQVAPTRFARAWIDTGADPEIVNNDGAPALPIASCFGLLCLNQGQVAGKRIIAADWVRDPLPS